MSKNKRTKNQIRQKDQYPDKPRFYKQNGKFVEFGSIDDLISRTEWRFYKFLSDIFIASAVLDEEKCEWELRPNGEKFAVKAVWKKREGAIFNNPLESWSSFLENLDLRDELVNRKLIFQSDKYYFQKALEYQKYLSEGGKPLDEPNSNIHSVEWLEPDSSVLTEVITPT